MDVRIIDDGNHANELFIAGYIKNKYYHYTGSKAMVTDLLELDDTNNDTDTMTEFLPFTVIIVTEGIVITSMEVPDVDTVPDENQDTESHLEDA